MMWLLIPLCLLMAVALTWMADKSLNKAPEKEVCEHPWYIDGRCIVCGDPK